MLAWDPAHLLAWDLACTRVPRPSLPAWHYSVPAQNPSICIVPQTWPTGMSLEYAGVGPDPSTCLGPKLVREFLDLVCWHSGPMVLF